MTANPLLTFRRPLAVFAALLGLGAALAWWAPSAAFRYAIGYAAQTAGLRVAALQNAFVSLRAGEFELAKLELANAAGTALRLDRFDLDFSWRELLRGRIEAPRVELSGLSLELARSKDGSLSLAGLPLAAGGPAQPKPSGGIAVWPVAIGSFVLADSTLVYRDGAAHTTLEIRRLAVERFEFDDPKRAIRFALTAALDGAPVELRGTAGVSGETPSFAGRLTFDGLALGPVARHAGVEVAGRIAGALDIAAQAGKAASVSGKLEATGISIELGAFAANADLVAFDGTVELSTSGAPSVAGDVAAANASVRASSGSGEFESLKLEELRLRSEPGGKIDVRTAAAASNLRVAGDGFAISGETLTAAVLGATLSADGSLEGRATLQVGKLEATAPAFKTTLDRAGIDGRVSARDAAVEFDGTVDLQDGRADLGATAIAAGRLAHSGRIAWRDGTAAYDGTAALERLQVKLPDARMTVASRAARFAGTVSAGAAYAASGRLRIDEAAIDSDDGRTLASLAALDVAQVAADADGLQAPRVDIDGLRILRRLREGAGQPAFPWRLEAAKAAVSDLRVAGASALAAAELKIDKPTIRLTRVKTGWLSLAASQDDGAPPPVPADAPAPLRYSLGRLVIAGGTVAFEDRNPHTPVRLALDRVEATVADIDNSRPERPLSFGLAARVGGFGSLKAQGTANPFSPRVSFDLELAAKALELPPVSAYVDRALGVELRTGTGDIDAKLAAREEKLDGVTKWRFANLRLDTRGPADGAQPALPVDTVLSLLSDGDGNIELVIPVSGELYNPEFDTADAVRQAVAGAVEGALSATLSVLFPVGAFVSGILENERRGTNVTLPAVAFAPGLADLDAGALKTVEPLAALMAARPAARIELCGFARKDEIDKAESGQLAELAGARASSVKRHLVDGAGINPSRVFECRPAIDDAPGAKPRVELRFQ